MSHEEKIYFDKALAFGNKASSRIFCRFADIIIWIATQQGIKSIIHYVDDFLIISKTDRQKELDQFLRILDIMKVLFKESKLEGPSTEITFLGILINTESMSVSVPYKKKKKIKELLTEWSSRRWCYMKDLQSLVGSLIWLCQVVPQGRPFVQRFIKAQGVSKNLKHHIRFTKSMLADIQWWSNVIMQWPGTYLMEDQRWLQPNIYNLYTDASNIGGGAIFKNYFTTFIWANNLATTTNDIQE